MTGNGDNGKNHEKPGKSRQAGSREARLAAALRENLRRRKAQERGRGARIGPAAPISRQNGENP